MGECIKNLYEILEISKDASFDVIKSSYKRLVRIYHPDINKSFDAEIKFKLLNNAYEILSDPKKRKNYDSVLNALHEKDKKNEIKPDVQDIIKTVKITEAEAVFGAERTVNILNTTKCPKCLGKKFLNGALCVFCGGKGEKKEHKKINVKIDKGVKNGDLIFVCKANSNEIAPKNLFLKIEIEPVKKMYFEGKDIIVQVEIPLYDAILGIRKEINIENAGLIDLDIPPLIHPNTRIRLDIKSMAGENYYAQIEVIFPDFISNEEKSLYYRIKQINS